MSQLKPGDFEQIIRQFEASEVATLEIRAGDSEIFLSRDAKARPSWAGQDAPPAPAVTKAPLLADDLRAGDASFAEFEVPPGHVVVTAPSMGTFYRAEKPGAPAYVEMGQQVTPESELALVEVMKLFTTVRAGVRGRIVRILVDDSMPIALGQPLFLIEVHE